MSEHPPRGHGDPGGDDLGRETERVLDLRADPRTNTVVKWVLRTGLLVALVLLLVGLVLQLVGGNQHAVEVKMFDLLAPRPLGERVMAVGVLVLTLTPASGVLAVLFSWARERDRLYVGVGCVVVAVLAASVVVGLG